MPFPRTSIGPFYFWNLEGEVPHPQETVQVESRPGVDGDLVWFEGVHGQTFELVSRVDAVNSVAARAMVSLYRQQLVGANAVQLWIGGYLHPFHVVVRHVSQLEVRQLANATIGLNPPSRGLLVARWVLHPVYLS
jgi:hypothetical protein